MCCFLAQLELGFRVGSTRQPVPKLPKKDFVASVDGMLLVNVSGVYTFCTSSSDK